MNTVKFHPNIRRIHQQQQQQQQILLKYKLKQNELNRIQNQLQLNNQHNSMATATAAPAPATPATISQTDNIETKSNEMNDNAQKLAFVKSKIMNDYSNLYKSK